MTLRHHLPALGIAAAIAVVVVGIVIFLSEPDGKTRSSTSIEESSQPDRAHGLSTTASSHANKEESRPKAAPFGNAYGQIGHSAEIRSRFLQLAKKDKYSAIDEALRLNGADRDLALATLSAAWKTDPRRGFKELAQIIDQIAAYARSSSAGTATGKNASLPSLIQSLNTLAAFPNDPEMPLLAMRLANRLLDGPQRTAALSAAAVAYVGIDPSLAFSLGNALNGADQQQFINSFSRGWAARDPEAVAQWAASIEDPNVRASTLLNAVNSLSRTDPARAAAWIGNIPDGPSRQAAIRQLGTSWAMQDTAAALAWAGQLPDAAARQQAVTAIQTMAPVGVGIALAKPENGYPSAAQILPSGPAEMSGSVRAGDQIVGVLGANQQWVETANLPLSQLISMIRGTAGAPVQLRLLPAGATDPSLARTVTIVRQQILFKRPASGG
ncbi:MAG TPA: PDZ domain-containing protein [Chthoniobacterales bacterium]|nr:PDZ domain-containing protein [Chthoniobacterales bacterium]